MVSEPGFAERFRRRRLLPKAALIINVLMKCPQCGAATTQGQNYCGGCGRQLKNLCSECGTINPPFFIFCGQCGRNLADVGTLLLDRAGLILEADAAAMDMLNQKGRKVRGMPFALFVNVDDLVLFYSHWNELIRSSQRQNLEIDLNLNKDSVIHTQLVLRLLKDHDGKALRIRVEISDVTDRRQTLEDLQEKQDIIKLVASLTDAFHPSGRIVRGETIGGVLKKIGLISEAQYGFIARIDVRRKRMVSEFRWHASGAREARPSASSMAIERLRPVIEKLLEGQPYVVDDIGMLARPEQNLWRAWQHLEQGAILCQMIYCRKKPVGVLGLATDTAHQWPRHAILLVRLAGRLMADTLPRARTGRRIIQPPSAPISVAVDESLDPPSPEIIDIDDVEVIIEEDARKTKGAASLQMQISSGADHVSADDLRVFAAKDGNYQMTCPKCGRQEMVGPAVFEKMGSVLNVNCPCLCNFQIIREMRRSFRKAVRLEGIFARDVSDINKLEIDNVWGPMVVTNLSKTGLNFTSDKAGRLRPGDRVQLRFYLDNSSKTLIKKRAQVRSVLEDTVGCQFKGSDRYDVTLGFYFL